MVGRGGCPGPGHPRGVEGGRRRPDDSGWALAGPGPIARGCLKATALLLAALLSADPAAGQGAEGTAPDAEASAPADTLSLPDALGTALSGHPDIRSARADASAEAAARWADWGGWLPTATASMNVSRTDFTTVTFLSPEGVSRELLEPLEDVSKSVSQGLSFRWNLLEGGRRLAELKAGGAEREAAEQSLSARERAVVAEVKQAYFEALKQQELVEIARRQLENRRAELERTRRRYRIAAVSRADLLGTEGEVRAAELTLLDARDAAERARRELRVAMGEGGGGRPGERAERPVALAGAPPAPDPGGLTAGELAERAVAAHPELASLRARADAASDRLWGARSAYLPTVSLGFTHSRTENLGPQGDLFTFDPSNRANRFSVSASWELFDGFRRREETARASAARDRARAELALRRIEVEKQVRDLVDEVKRRARRVELLERQLEVAEERLELVREQFRAGTADFTDLQTAIDGATSAERSLVQERYDYLSAWARLERWAGDAVSGPGPVPPGSGGS